ncbi:serine hydrolase [Ruegeria arenilitoris]|uniref:serine hydrolase n=1 Tax=Ruegeria arenilitoris TaxID=1173585 RepID=UPI001481524D|nr:serine hydrolase [Ruegeria arenilitoris]
MQTNSISRRFFLGSATASLVGMPLTAYAQTPSPSQMAGVAVPPGQIATAIAALDDIVAEIMARSGIPGVSVAVVHKGETVLTNGYGLRRVGSSDTINPDTVFQIASVSKSVGATVVAQQVGQGVVSWDSPMHELLPWFRLSDPARSELLTIGDLYSHRSGLPDHAGDDLEDLGFDRTTILEHLRLLPLAPFRTSYAYTNFGLTAAAEAVAEKAGMDWATLSEQAIYQPLGMTRTSSRFADYMAVTDRAVPHTPSDGVFLPQFQRMPDAQSPAGGVSSSANDMARWMQLILANGRYGDDQIIPPEALLPAISPQTVSSPPTSPDSRAGFYGFGFNVSTEPSGRVKLSHSGAFVMGTGTCFSLIPSLDLGIVVLSNASPVGAVESIAAEFTDLAQFGKQTRDWYAGYSQLFKPFFDPLGHTVGAFPPVDAAVPLNFETAVGKYSHPYFGTVEIQATGEQLVLLVGPHSQDYLLQPWDGATMVFDFVTENAPPGSRSMLTFEDLASGKAGSIVVELFGEHEPSRFIRV